MDTLEKVQQLFVQMNHDRREESIKTKVQTHRQGGLRWQGGDAKANLLQNMTFRKYSKIPLLIAANCDDGGDGVEERDQHLLLGVNDLSVEEWDSSFRKVYQTMIDEDLEAIMVGHIALPEMSRKHAVPLGDAKGKRAKLYYIFSKPESVHWKHDPIQDMVKEEIKRLGYEVDVAPNFYELDRTNPAMSKPIMMSIGKHETFWETYDVVFMVVYMKGYAQENNIRLAFSCGHSNEMPWYIHEVPTPDCIS